MRILGFLVLSSFFTCLDGYAQKANIDINVIAPHLPEITDTSMSRDQKLLFQEEFERWQIEYYSEFDTVRSCILQMFLDNSVQLYFRLDGDEIDATNYYRLKSWELKYGLSEDEWGIINARIQEYRNRN